MKVEVDPDDIQKLNSDGRGRVYLGSEYADLENIEVAVLSDPGEENE